MDSGWECGCGGWCGWEVGRERERRWMVGSEGTEEPPLLQPPVMTTLLLSYLLDPPHTWQTFLLSYLEQSLHPHLPLAWKPSQLLSEADVENGTFAVWSTKTSSPHLLWCNASCSWVSYVSVAVNCCSSAVSGCQCQCIARLSFPLEANGRIRLSTLVTLSVDASAMLYLYFYFLQYRRLNTVVFVLVDFCNFISAQAVHTMDILS